MKRRQPVVNVGACAPALPATSVLLAKLPAIREFLSATGYDDGSPRVPGYLTLRNRGHSYEITLYDPDAGLRLPARGPDLDKTLLLAEQLLGVQEAPWEVDNYLTEQLAKKSKKRRAS